MCPLNKAFHRFIPCLVVIKISLYVCDINSIMKIAININQSIFWGPVLLLNRKFNFVLNFIMKFISPKTIRNFVIRRRQYANQFDQRVLIIW